MLAKPRAPGATGPLWSVPVSLQLEAALLSGARSAFPLAGVATAWLLQV